MERYIIPFEYKSRSHYVFIERYPGADSFGITQLVPETDELVVRQIPVKDVRSFTEPLNPGVSNMQQTIIRCLASYLQKKGWPIDEESARD